MSVPNGVEHVVIIEIFKKIQDSQGDSELKVNETEKQNASCLIT